MTQLATRPKPRSSDASEVGISWNRLYRLSVAQYYDMIAHGILPEDVRTELLHGLVVRKMTPQPPHACAVQLLTETLIRLVPDGWAVRAQNPITLDDSAPEPDVVVARGSTRSYAERHPVPSDIGLVVEVADSSLQDDRRVKGSIYAASRISTYWILDLVGSQLEVYALSRRSKQRSYPEPTIYKAGQTVPLVLTGHEVARIPVKDLLPV